MQPLNPPPARPRDLRRTSAQGAARLRLLLRCALALLLASASALAKPPDALVAEADAIRFPSQPFQVLVTVLTTDTEGEVDEYVYQVLQKGHDHSVVRTLKPASNSGQVMLLRGDDLWVFLPEVSQPVRLPLAQRLTGQVANGDLARANFADDYEVVSQDFEEIDGQRYAVLELNAAHRGVTYHRVRYWINVANSRPHKVEFYTLSNRLMKTGYYENFEELGGAIRPTRLVLKDALREGEESVLIYSELELRDIPDKFFTKQYLRKLQH